MPRDHNINEQRLAVLRDELARTRARLEQARAERDDLERRLNRLLALLVQRRAMSHEVAVHLARDLAAVAAGDAR